MKSIKLAAALAVLSLGQLANANIVVNGSFEEPNQAPGTWEIYETIPGWTLSPDIEIRNDIAGAAFEGSNYVELDTRTNRSGESNSTISQTLATVAGAQYELTFAYSPREGVNRDSNGIAVILNDVRLDRFSGSGAGQTGNNWATFSIFFTATSNADVLRFRAVGIDDQVGGSLDDVRVNAVPLPGTVALLGLGLIGFGAVRRRAAK